MEMKAIVCMLLVHMHIMARQTTVIAKGVPANTCSAWSNC